MKSDLIAQIIHRSSVVLLLFFTTIFPLDVALAKNTQNGTIKEQAVQAIVNGLSPEEKVGQLFLVGFSGNQVTTTSKIYDLIVNYHIGGVVLRSANDNFTGPDGTIGATYQLISALQNAANTNTENIAGGIPLSNQESTYIPLFVGISQDGDLAPSDQIINGLTSLPNEMAIGASWNKENAFKVGTVLGQELSSLGFNLLLGPSLDVLDEINTTSGGDLGTKTFSGDPYWVGALGKSYIRGVHQGSQWRMLVISKNFPGRGGSDRPPEEEVATVRKSLEQLKQIELAPFFSVTGSTSDNNEITDGLLLSHIRYQGFQGNIRATTKPVSFDASALGLILNLEPLSIWRSKGGIMVTDNLGSQAVRRFFDPNGSSFDARTVASSAFLAGSDLLYVDTNFIGSDDADSYATLIKTLDYFSQKYREDPVFAERVDQSIIRLLTLKSRLYPRFDPSTVMPAEDEMVTVGNSPQITFDVARQAATLISPDDMDLKNVLPRPPENRERIIFFTDTLTAQQCKQCVSQSIFSVDSFQNAVIKLYGPKASGQVIGSHLSSYTFSALNAYLNDPAGNPDLEGNLQNADWVVFSILNLDPKKPESYTLVKFINSREDLIRNKKILVFAFNAPYYLDATDISKVSAYYCVYSKASPFIDIAARILFQEHFPTGASPVSVPGNGYELIDAMSPDPEQIIQLTIDSPEIPISPDASPQPTEIPSFYIGDSLPLRAGLIIDYNHHPVPDGTVVKFIITTNEETGSSQQIEATTQDGIARTSYRIINPGLIQIRVVSEPATISNELQLQVTEGEAAQITAIEPTLQPTSTPLILTTQTVEGEEEENTTNSESVPTGIISWLISSIVIWLVAGLIYWFGNLRYSQRWGLRWALCALCGGLIAYSLCALDLPGIAQWIETGVIYMVPGISVLGALIGVGIGAIWKNAEQRHLDSK